MKITKFSLKLSMLLQTLRIFGFSWCLLFSSFIPLQNVQADDISEDLKEEIESLTEDDREALKNAEIPETILEVANDAAEETKVNWSENDRGVLKLLGYSDEEIDDLSLASAMDDKEREKFQNRAQNYAKKKQGDVAKAVKNDMIPGLASSVIGLAFTAFLGLVIGFRCRNQPSGLAFAATAGSWLALELMTWKGYQIRQKDFETVSQMGKIPERLQPKVNKAKKILKEIEIAFKASEVQNFEAFLEQQKPKVDELREIASEIRKYLNVEKDRQFGALRSIKESIELAAETSRKKARNAKIAAIGYTAAAGLAAGEFANVINAGGTCTGTVPAGSFLEKGEPNKLIDFFLPTAHAGFATIGDLDKIGIPIGGGLAAAYLFFEKTWGHQVYSTPQGRGIAFLAMAGIGAIAAVKLKKAASFLDQQAKEMELFINAIEEKFSGISVSFPDGDALIKELKDKLLPKLEEIENGLADDAKILEDKIRAGLEDKVAEVKGKIDEEKLKEMVEKEKNLAQSEIENSIKESNAMSFSNLEMDDLKGRLSGEVTPEPRWFDFLFPNAFALSKTPSGCFKRTASFLVMDESCSCRTNKKCNRSLYPSKMSFPRKSEFGPFVFQMGALVSQSSDSIFWGNPLKGVQGFSKAGSLKAKMEANSRRIMSQKAGAKIDQRLTASMIGKTLKGISPALNDYFRESARSSSPSIHPGLSQNIIDRKKRSVLPASSRATALRASLRKRLTLAKALGNPSLTGYVEPVRESVQANGKAYNYSKESIIRDPSKDIFQIIKKRYLIIQSENRLSF